MPCQMSCSGAWLQRSHHSPTNTPLRHECCECHVHAIADLATPRVARPRVFPNSWQTASKPASNSTDALHRTSEKRVRGDSGPRGQSPMVGIRATAARAPWIAIPWPRPFEHNGSGTSTSYQHKHHRHPSSPSQLTTAVGEWRTPCRASCLVASPQQIQMNVSYGVRTHAQLPAVDLKSTPLTTRAN
jgi:hypothetical protein